MNLAQIRTAVLNRLVGVADAVSDEVDQLINDAVLDAQDEHNFQVMKGTVTANTVLANHQLVNPLPADWKEPRGRPFYTDTTGKEVFLNYLPDTEDLAKEFDTANTTEKGAPRALRVSMIDDLGTLKAEVFPFPDGLSGYTGAPAGEYRMTVPYWRYLPELANDSDENWFTDVGYQYIIAQATARGFLLDWDEQRGGAWLKIADMQLRSLKALDARGQVTPSGFLHVRTDAYGSRRQGRL